MKRNFDKQLWPLFFYLLIFFPKYTFSSLLSCSIWLLNMSEQMSMPHKWTEFFVLLNYHPPGQPYFKTWQYLGPISQFLFNLSKNYVIVTYSFFEMYIHSLCLFLPLLCYITALGQAYPNLYLSDSLLLPATNPTHLKLPWLHFT